MRKFGLCLFYGLCVFTIAFSLFWMALPRLPLPEAPADETPPISGSVSSLVQAAAPTAAGYYLCDTGGRVAVYACNADGTPGALQQLTGIYVNLLPENDVLRIRRGIRGAQPAGAGRPCWRTWGGVFLSFFQFLLTLMH